MYYWGVKWIGARLLWLTMDRSIWLIFLAIFRRTRTMQWTMRMILCQKAWRTFQTRNWRIGNANERSGWPICSTRTRKDAWSTNTTRSISIRDPRRLSYFLFVCLIAAAQPNETARPTPQWHDLAEHCGRNRPVFAESHQSFELCCLLHGDLIHGDESQSAGRRECWMHSAVLRASIASVPILVVVWKHVELWVSRIEAAINAIEE